MPSSTPLYSVYAPILLILAVAALLAGLFFVGATFLGGKLKQTPEKMLPFECGSESSGGRHLKLSVKFYLTAILFVVFDIEAVFIYPWAVQFKALGWTGLASMAGFLAVVVVALVYCWRKGALEWES
jgi:NADH-quinone oxidoreductase subunit A